MEIIWTERASQDLEIIFRYVATTSEYYAKDVLKNILEAPKTLKLFPEAGRLFSEKKIKGYREIFIYSYRLIYRVSDKKIYVVALVHMRRSFKLKQRLN